MLWFSALETLATYFDCFCNSYVRSQIQLSLQGPARTVIVTIQLSNKEKALFLKLQNVLEEIYKIRYIV